MYGYDHISLNGDITAILDRFDAFPTGCDPDFDTGFDELEREFVDLDGEPLEPDCVGRKWLVVVDYHN